MTTKEVAEDLGLTENALAIWRHRGEGPKYIKISRRAVRYRESDIQEWLEMGVIETNCPVSIE